MTRPITWGWPGGIGLKLALLLLSGVVGLVMAELLLCMINPTGRFFAASEMS